MHLLYTFIPTPKEECLGLLQLQSLLVVGTTKMKSETIVFIAIFLGLIIKASYATENITYHEIHLSETNVAGWKCERSFDMRSYSWIDCAVWCQKMQCEVFSFRDDDGSSGCAVCSRSSDFSANLPEQLTFTKMYGKLTISLNDF